MGIFSNLFGQGTKEVIDSVGDAIDNIVTSDEERIQLQVKLEEIQANLEIRTKELDNKYEAEITKRNLADQTSGNFLTKSVRPLFLYWCMIMVTGIIVMGLMDKTLPEAYLYSIFGLTGTAVTFFFGSKGMEIYKHGKVI